MTEEKEIVAEATSEVKEEAANVMESVVRDEKDYYRKRNRLRHCYS